MSDQVIMEAEALATEARLAPVTSKRKVHDHLETSLPKPYLARALVAPDTEHSTGTAGHKHNDQSVLQQHVSFFDKDHNRIVYPRETYAGVVTFSFLSHIYQQYSQAKHGSDSGSYDTEGRFMPVNFENIFSKYSHKVPGKLTLRELWNMTEGNKVSFDIIGRIIAKLEWGLVYYVARDEHGFLTKETMRTLFDGSLFEHLAKKHSGFDAKMG